MSEITGIDHLYIAVRDLDRSSAWYDRAMTALGFRRNEFLIGGERHVQYYNRHFGYVLRPARGGPEHDPYAPGLHHLCLRLETVQELRAAVAALLGAGIEASEPVCYPDYAPDYWASHLRDPDGLHLELTNYRQERRERHDHWQTLEAPVLPLSRAFAEHFAAEWIAAWNGHDLARILSHYHEDFEMSSPRIVDLAGEPSGRLRGKAAVGAYWAKALALMPELRFTLIDCYLGADSVSLHYQGARGPAVETFFFDAQGRVLRAAAHYR